MQKTYNMICSDQKNINENIYFGYVVCKILFVTIKYNLVGFYLVLKYMEFLH